MIDYVSKIEENDIKFTVFLPLGTLLNYNDINDNDICTWSQIWRNLYGCDVLSMIRNMFMYTVLCGKKFDYDYSDKIRCVDMTLESSTYQNWVQHVLLHVLNSKIIDFLSYYIDSHHFEQIKLSNRVTLQFIIDHDFENQLHCHDDHSSNSNMKGDHNQQHIAPNTMSFDTIVNEAANTNTLPYWNYCTYGCTQYSLIPQCLSPVQIKNFRYNNECSLYIGNNGKHRYHGNIYTCNGTSNLKFFNLCNAFQYFDKIEILKKRVYQIHNNLHAMNWIRNVCNENPWSDESKSNYKRQWIVVKTEKNDQINNIFGYGYFTSDYFVKQYFAPQSLRQLQAWGDQTRDDIRHQINHSQSKSKLYHIFVQKINAYNYSLFYSYTNNQRQYKHYKDYNSYLKGIDKDKIPNYNENWIELKYFRKHNIKNSDIENKFNQNRVKKQLGLHIKTPNCTILNIAVLYKQEEILKCREILLKLKQGKYGIFTTKHDGFDKLGKDVFLKSICINFLYPFEIFLLSRLNRGFYQLLHSDYTIVKKYLVNREHETHYYLKGIKNTISMLAGDAGVKQNLLNRVRNGSNDDIHDCTVSEFWGCLLHMLKCFNKNKGVGDTSFHLLTIKSPNIDMLNIIGNHDHKTECGSDSDNCDCNDLTAHPRLNILRQIGKMCLFWMLISGSKEYDTLVIRKFGLFTHLITVNQLISCLAFHYNYLDSNGDTNNCNINKNICCNDEIFLHNIDTIKCANVRLVLTQSKMYKMYSNDPQSFLIEYRACDSQFINYFDQFRYNRKSYNCFAKIGKKNELELNDQQIRQTQGEKCVDKLICLHVNKVFDKYWNHVIFGSHDALDKFDDIMEWLYGLNEDSWNNNSIKIILFSCTFDDSDVD